MHRRFSSPARTWLKKWCWLSGPALGAAIPLGIVLAVALVHVDRDWVSRGDYAFIELSTRSALHGHALVGPYSRYGWNHPGPAMFYWYAPFFWSFRQRPESLGVAAASFNLVAMVTCVAVTGIASGKRAAWVSAVGACLVVRVWGFSWIDRIWNPFIVLTAILASAFLGAGFLAGRKWLLAGFVGVSSFCVQSHVGTAPLIGLMSLYLIAASVPALRREAWAVWKLPILAAAGAAVLAWSLPVYEQLTGHPGNVGQILQFVRNSEADHGLREVLDKVVVQLTLNKLDLISNVVSTKRMLPMATPAKILLLVVLLGVNAFGVWANRRAGRNFERHLCLLAILGTAAVILSGLRVVGELEGYLTMPALAVGVLLWAGAVLTTSAMALQWLDARMSIQARVRAMSVMIVGVATVVGSGWSSYDTIARKDPQRSLQVGPSPDTDAIGIADTIRNAVPEGVRRVRLEADGPNYSTAGMVGNQIELGGFEVRVKPSLDVYFGRERRADGCESFVVRVGGDGQPRVVGAGQILGTYAGHLMQARMVQPPGRCE